MRRATSPGARRGQRASSVVSIQERLVLSRSALRRAERATAVARGSVDQQLADSRHCLRLTADLLVDLRRRLRP